MQRRHSLHSTRPPALPPPSSDRQRLHSGGDDSQPPLSLSSWGEHRRSTAPPTGSDWALGSCAFPPPQPTSVSSPSLLRLVSGSAQGSRALQRCLDVSQLSEEGHFEL